MISLAPMPFDVPPRSAFHDDAAPYDRRATTCPSRRDDSGPEDLPEPPLLGDLGEEFA